MTQDETTFALADGQGNSQPATAGDIFRLEVDGLVERFDHQEFRLRPGVGWESVTPYLTRFYVVLHGRSSLGVVAWDGSGVEIEGGPSGRPHRRFADVREANAACAAANAKDSFPKAGYVVYAVTRGGLVRV